MRTRLLTAGLLAAAAALTGCGRGDADSASVPDGWGTLSTKGVSVSYPAGSGGYVEQSAAERGKYNAAAAVREKSGRTVSVITVQLDFTRAGSAEQAAIAAEAGIRMGAKVEGEKDVKLTGTDQAKRIDFTFDSTGEDGDPPKGTSIRGVILTGLDSADRTFAIRIDAARGVLSSADLRGIIDSVRVH
ncbi:hypothetical protein ACIQMV_05000 [Streptomyces sp. NPDC091412]|uniref:hypothetical protein n=1 Tax=Streptomyces sp. NPDC091412 TaxID=3366002 RepID=UPI00382D0ACF